MTTYYVDAINGYDGDLPLSQVNSCKTIAKLNSSSFQPGDTILFKCGQTWYEQLTIPSSGVNGNPITFGSFGSGVKPIISGATSGSPTVPVRGNCITAADKHHIVIEGLQLKYGKSRGIYNDRGNSWIIRNNDILNTGDGTAPDNAITVSPSVGNTLITGLEIHNNYISGVGVVEDVAIGFAGIMVQKVSEAKIYNNKIITPYCCAIRTNSIAGYNNIGLEIHDNHIIGSASGIIIMYTSSSYVYDNLIHDGKGSGIGVAYESHYNKIHHNSIVNCPNGAVSGGSITLWNGIDIVQNSDYGECYRNVVNRVHGQCLVIDDIGGSSDNWIITDNVFDARGNGNHPTYGHHSIKWAQPISGCFSDRNVFYNDISSIAYYADQEKTFEQYRTAIQVDNPLCEINSYGN